ncbi:IclR family transcriptional regulator [Paracoccus aminophilus]|uniref:IclR family transcriptional regulator n=1 Tax=Paracoccus aminophilus TaxID=34003 RepID=UPI000417F0FD|nr:IclR family transcriptional regulator [Paracoccus aminophilus]
METTVVKGLRVLEAMAQNPELCNLTALANECGISKSNAHRLLQTLEACGYVTRDAATRTYRPTLRQWEMGRRVYDRLSLPTVAGRHLAQLSQDTEETAHLSVFDQGQVLYIDKVDGPHAVRTYVSNGEREPAFCTSSGKAMLAWLPHEELLGVGEMIQKFTENTVGSLPELQAQLADVRARGYATTSGEYRLGVTSFARAIKTPSNKVIGAVGVAGPVERMSLSDPERYHDALARAVSLIETDLGFPA